MDTHNKEGESHKHVKSHSGGQNNFLDSLRENPWILTSIVLALVLIVVIAFGNNIFQGSGASVSKETAAGNVISFINSQGGDTASLVSAEQEGGLYKVTVDYMGNQIPVYTTLDGKSLVVNPISLSGAATSDSSSQGSTTPTPTVPKSDKPIVELFVMSHCPYGTQMEKGILPVVELLGNKIDFKVKFVYYAMHGKEEVNEQTRQYCIQEEQTDKFQPYLKCFLKAGNTDACLIEAKVDNAKLQICVNATDKKFNISKNFNDQSSWLSGRFPKFDTSKEENEKYGVAGSPTLIINGQDAPTGRDPASLLKAICGAFNTAPAECSQTLSSASPSPGFGEGTAAASGGAANAPGCIV
ncbi:MAG: hypothetical protein Q8Q31_03545 [Nanoarchaeota archaeon]|nr:hypothetical protein [Nanoarchaeota archaeon]